MTGLNTSELEETYIFLLASGDILFSKLDWHMDSGKSSVL